MGCVIHQNDQLIKGFRFLCHMLTFDEKNFEHFFEKLQKKISKNFQILFFSETHFEQEKKIFIFRPNVPKNLLKFWQNSKIIFCWKLFWARKKHILTLFCWPLTKFDKYGPTLQYQDLFCDDVASSSCLCSSFSILLRITCFRWHFLIKVGPIDCFSEHIWTAFDKQKQLLNQSHIGQLLNMATAFDQLGTSSNNFLVFENIPFESWAET